VFISGDFSSGTTLLFTMFRHVEGCCCFYEPLHERLLNWLIWPPRVWEGHVHAENYVKEYRGLDAVRQLSRPEWGYSRLHLDADADEPELERYLRYLIGSGYGKAPCVVLKENRFTFRLGWLRAHFPEARIVNVWRDCEEQWRSWVRRSQEYRGVEDVGQDSVEFRAFRLPDWCDDLKSTYPELGAERSSSGYERFSKLWQLSREQHERFADVCVSLDELRNDFDRACERISAAVGFELEPTRLRHLVSRGGAGRSATGIEARAARLLDRAGARYAAARLELMRRRGKLAA